MEGQQLSVISSMLAAAFWISISYAESQHHGFPAPTPRFQRFRRKGEWERQHCYSGEKGDAGDNDQPGRKRSDANSQQNDTLLRVVQFCSRWIQWQSRRLLGTWQWKGSVGCGISRRKAVEQPAGNLLSDMGFRRLALKLQTERFRVNLSPLVSIAIQWWVPTGAEAIHQE